MLRIVVTGAKGRMGGKITELIRGAPDLELAAGIDAGDSLAEAARDCDVIIDFSTASASAENARIAAAAKRPIVTGTTGIDEAGMAAIRESAGRVAVVLSPNMSIGVNVMFELLRSAARALGPDFSVFMEETHHVHKLDRPSGTARGMLAALRSAGRAGPVAHVQDDEEAKISPGNAGIVLRSVRRGEVVGDHLIRFSAADEEITISHHAGDRRIFARGAIAAARWIAGKPPGLYDMSDVLGIK